MPKARLASARSASNAVMTSAFRSRSERSLCERAGLVIFSVFEYFSDFGSVVRTHTIEVCSGQIFRPESDPTRGLLTRNRPDPTLGKKFFIRPDPNRGLLTRNRSEPTSKKTDPTRKKPTDFFGIFEQKIHDSDDTASPERTTYTRCNMAAPALSGFLEKTSSLLIDFCT